jgi:hypothetical protein
VWQGKALSEPPALIRAMEPYRHRIKLVGLKGSVHRCAFPARINELLADNPELRMLGLQAHRDRDGLT